MGCSTWVREYWRIVVPAKSGEDVDAEGWLVLYPQRNRLAAWRCIRFSRWHVAVMVWLTYFMLGSVYSFQILTTPLERYFAQPTYSGSSGFFGSTLVLGIVAAVVGPVIERRGPRVGMVIGSVLVVAGLAMAHLAVAVRAPYLFTISYSILVGSGYGFVLIATMSTVQKWFPDFRGLVAGAAILCMGLGTGIWTKLAAVLMHRAQNVVDSAGDAYDELGLQRIFLAQGGAALVILLVTTMVVRTPPSDFSIRGHDIHCIPVNKAPPPRQLQDDYFKVGMTLVNFGQDDTDNVYFEHVRALTLVDCILSSDFVWLYVAFAANVAPIVMFVPEIFDLATGVLFDSSDGASSFVSLLFLSTSLGRVAGPLASDVVIRTFYMNPAYGRKLVLGILLTIQAVATGLLLANVGSGHTSSIRWPSYALGFALGGGFAIMPALVTDMFGVFNTGTMYGLLLTSWSIGATAWGFVGRTTSITQDSVEHHLRGLCVVGCIGVVVLTLVRTNTTDRFYRGYQLTWCNTVVVQVPSRQMRLDRLRWKDMAPTASALDDWIDQEVEDRLSKSHASPTLSQGPYGQSFM
ncbi:hypothetical protein H310_12444 [Aphanomyces invadans]|uniref:Major facilitator superfamily (MFS) profile domain-containing protein n=1 Tax=Aphanomyces invadans TaxID=157072 RepID=A0A024TJY6_9STRA|nr:hypothetical protein H310_12444 [Aphanomyces invadans]ETV93677.1 hypothetical protein H310_12444 [Aphanomyces invadans]|eukprot:XP_008877718.1 hypothetical protein H310_12444 [Aphanomyces invadans]